MGDNIDRANALFGVYQHEEKVPDWCLPYTGKPEAKAELPATPLDPIPIDRQTIIPIEFGQRPLGPFMAQRRGPGLYPPAK